jgi:hypothetical protein
VTLEAEAPKMDEACKVEKRLAHKKSKSGNSDSIISEAAIFEKVL